jgi:opacity protein-like surface antigen
MKLMHLAMAAVALASAAPTLHAQDYGRGRRGRDDRNGDMDDRRDRRGPRPLREMRGGAGPELSLGLGPTWARQPSSFQNQVNRGFNAGASLGLPVARGFALRLGYDYNDFPRTTNALTGFTPQATTVKSGTADLVAALPFDLTLVSPYIFAGGGVACVAQDPAMTSADAQVAGYRVPDETALSWDAGVGLKALLTPHMGIFAEASYTSIYTQARVLRILPLKFGITLHGGHGWRGRRGGDDDDMHPM